MPYTVLSRHFFRRRARDEAHQLERDNPELASRITTIEATRAPYRWYVILRPKSPVREDPDQCAVDRGAQEGQ